MESFTSQEVAAAGMPLLPRMRQDAASTELARRRMDGGKSTGRKRWFSNHDGRGKESGRQKVSPKGIVFFEKNGVSAFPNWSRPQKHREKRASMFWKK
jgi:hypothetical protein